MPRAEAVALKLRFPSKAKREWLDRTAGLFHQGVQLALDYALSAKTSNRGKIHAATYSSIRALGLPSEYCRMAVNEAVQVARSHFGLRKKKRRAGKPRVRTQRIGLGVSAYKVVGTALRVSTEKKGEFLWFPLSVPAHFRDKLQYVKGDARLFRRGDEWFVMLPLSVPHTPTVRDGDGQVTVIGVDLGIARLLTAKHPQGCLVVNGKPIRHRRERFASLRQRLQRHRRTDRVRAIGSKERRWMTHINHKVSKQLVDLAARYPNPVLALERLDGIRDRVRGSKKFNRTLNSWAFRQLVDFVQYKAARKGVQVVFVDPRGTSRTCPRCGHADRSNRTTQAIFRCVACGYQGNADVVASLNIAAAALDVLRHGPPDTARPHKGQAPSVGRGLGGVKVWVSAHTDSNLQGSM